MSKAIMALQQQAQAWVASTDQALAAAGRGFTDADRAAIAASHAAHPVPEGEHADAGTTAQDQAAAADLARQAMTAEYPPEGLAADDPRLAPVEGVTLALYAIGAKAIGWSTDEAHIDRVVAALGVDRAAWDRAAVAIRERITTDVVLGTFYGQLYLAA